MTNLLNKSKIIKVGIISVEIEVFIISSYYLYSKPFDYLVKGPYNTQLTNHLWLKATHTLNLHVHRLSLYLLITSVYHQSSKLSALATIKKISLFILI